MTEPDEMPVVEGELVPLTWGVQCPSCGGIIEIDKVEEDDAGIWFASDEDCAPECHACHICVTSQGVALQQYLGGPYHVRRT